MSSGSWVAVIGWPAVAAALVLMGAAVAKRSRRLAGVGCLLIAPICLYLTATPRFQLLAPLAFASACLAASRIDAWPRTASVALLLPAAALFGWLANTVATQ